MKMPRSLLLSSVLPVIVAVTVFWLASCKSTPDFDANLCVLREIVGDSYGQVVLRSRREWLLARTEIIPPTKYLDASPTILGQGITGDLSLHRTAGRTTAPAMDENPPVGARDLVLQEPEVGGLTVAAWVSKPMPAQDSPAKETSFP